MILPVKTHSRTEMIDITDDVQAAIREAGVRDGFCMVFVPPYHRGGNDQMKTRIRR